MIFAELVYPQHYAEMHDELHAFLDSHFARIESGHQGDSWFWVFEGDEKVAIDTFTSMKHQVKSGKPGPHVQEVVDALRTRYPLLVHDTPIPEPHEA